jgi:PAS domain S-box-containing protein
VRLQGARILVVDDHADLVENLQEILEYEGAVVSSASSAAAGLQKAAAGYDVALVDVRLPDGRGPEIVPRLRAGDGLEEVLLVTGHASIADAVEAVKAGASAYILKPFDPEDLIATVLRAWDQVRLARRAAALATRLEQSEDALRTMVDTVQALLLVLDESNAVQQANRAVAAATGTPLSDIIGTVFADAFVPRRERAEFKAACAIAAERESASLESTVLMRTEGGGVEERSVRWQLAGLDVGGQRRVYASGLDLTDVRDLERRTRLAEKLAAVGTISAGLAHEIRNPLNAASLQLQLLERRLTKAMGDSDAKGTVMEPAQMVREEIERLSRLVTEFLSFARPTALNLADVDLADLARRVIDLERPVADDHETALTFSGPERPLIVAVDAERIKQVLLNLVRNALDAVEAGGNVRVSVETDGAGARITIADDGPGIPVEIEARIFEPFFTTKERGTGLGMAIAHKIIDQHGGTLSVDGQSGATFTITLPRRAPIPL